MSNIERRIEDLIYTEERRGYPYFIVEGPDGISHGCWDKWMAQAIARAKIEADDSSNS